MFHRASLSSSVPELPVANVPVVNFRYASPEPPSAMKNPSLEMSPLVRPFSAAEPSNTRGADEEPTFLTYVFQLLTFGPLNITFMLVVLKLSLSKNMPSLVGRVRP